MLTSSRGSTFGVARQKGQVLVCGPAERVSRWLLNLPHGGSTNAV